MKQHLIVFSLAAALALPVAADAQTAFTRDLTFGSRGADILLLQQTLNRDARTRLAALGPGAPGQETTYFGPLTHSAVVRFQELYRTTVLAPIGLVRGTGFVGPLTRAELNEALESGVAVTADEPAPAPPRVFSISPSRGGAGTAVTIEGSGFLPTGNSVVAVFEQFDNVPSPDGRTLVVTFEGPFPEEFIAENQEVYNELELEMPYTILVRNRAGSSNTVTFYFTLYEE